MYRRPRAPYTEGRDMDTFDRQGLKWQAALGDRDAARLLSEEAQSVAASLKALGDVMERNRWVQCCRGLTPEALGKTPEGNLSFIRDTVTRLHSTEAVAWRRRTYEAGIFAIGRELDRRKLATAAPAPAKTKAAPPRPAPASPTAELEAEIIRILNRDFPNLKARPTASELYQEHVINGRTMTGLARAKGWKVRTMKARKADIKAHLTRTLNTPVDLNALRTAPRKGGRIVYTDPGVIERTHGNDTRRDEG